MHVVSVMARDFLPILLALILAPVVAIADDDDDDGLNKTVAHLDGSRRTVVWVWPIGSRNMMPSIGREIRGVRSARKRGIRSAGDLLYA